MKKSILLPVLVLLSCFSLQAQKKTTTLASNLNLSKSNINRMAYDTQILTAAQAESLLADAEKEGIRDAAKMKTWLAANFKRLGVHEEKIKVFDVYVARENSSCNDCKKNCKGRCMWEGNESCTCYYHSEPNLRTTTELPPAMLIVLLTDAAQEDSVFQKSGGKGGTKSE